MADYKHCTECNYSLQGYAPDETLCGACYNATTQYKYEAPVAVTDQLLAAYAALNAAQDGANRCDRGGLGRELERIRWALGDLYAQIRPLHILNTETGVWDDSHPFANATERGE